MNGFLRRLKALTIKEIRQISRDPSSIMIGIALPIILILIFGYGLSLEREERARGRGHGKIHAACARRARRTQRIGLFFAPLRRLHARGGSHAQKTRGGRHHTHRQRLRQPLRPGRRRGAAHSARRGFHHGHAHRSVRLRAALPAHADQSRPAGKKRPAGSGRRLGAEPHVVQRGCRQHLVSGAGAHRHHHDAGGRVSHGAHHGQRMGTRHAGIPVRLARGPRRKFCSQKSFPTFCSAWPGFCSALRPRAGCFPCPCAEA